MGQNRLIKQIVIGNDAVLMGMLMHIYQVMVSLSEYTPILSLSVLFLVKSVIHI